MNSFTLIFLLALVICYATQFWLAKRQSDHVANHRSAVPDAFKDRVSLEAHQKAADYTIEKGKLGTIDSIIGIIILLLLTLGGGINATFEFWSGLTASPIKLGVGALATVFLFMALVDIPTSWYQTFVIEEKYGFNKSSVKQFVKDHLMQLGLSAAIGLPILALILWVMDSVGSLWWLWAWAIIMGFSLVDELAVPDRYRTLIQQVYADARRFA